MVASEGQHPVRKRVATAPAARCSQQVEARTLRGARQPEARQASDRAKNLLLEHGLDSAGRRVWTKDLEPGPARDANLLRLWPAREGAGDRGRDRRRRREREVVEGGRWRRSLRDGRGGHPLSAEEGGGGGARRRRSWLLIGESTARSWDRLNLNDYWSSLWLRVCRPGTGHES